MIKRLLNRREFNGLCVTLGSSLGAAAGMLGGTAGTWAMEIDSWHRFDPRKANSKVPRRHWARALHNSHREDVRKRLRKKHCELAFHLE